MVSTSVIIKLKAVHCGICDFSSFCLDRVFQNLPARSKQYSNFDVFADFQSLFQPENLGSHLAMSTDDRFLPQGKQILAIKGGGRPTRLLPHAKMPLIPIKLFLSAG